jgi:hypothetical protein
MVVTLDGFFIQRIANGFQQRLRLPGASLHGGSFDDEWARQCGGSSGAVGMCFTRRSDLQRRVLNRGEAVNAHKRAIYTVRLSPAQAKLADEMQAVLDRWSNRRSVIPPELIGEIAPTRLESINLRGWCLASRSTVMPIKSAFAAKCTDSPSYRLPLNKIAQP